MMGSGFGFGIPELGMIVIWGLLILLVVWLVRSISGERQPKGKDAQQIRDERYARGEIDREEYEHKKRTLR